MRSGGQFVSALLCWIPYHQWHIYWHYMCSCAGQLWIFGFMPKAGKWIHSLQWRHNERGGVSGADQRKHQSSGSLAFVRGIHRCPVNSPHKGPVTRKMFPFDAVIMSDVHMRLWFYSCTHLLDRTYREFHFVWLRRRVPFVVSNVGKFMVYSIIYSICDAQVFAEICLPELHYQFAMYPNAVKPLI